MGEKTGVKAIIYFFVELGVCFEFRLLYSCSEMFVFPISSNLSVLQGPPSPKWDS